MKPTITLAGIKPLLSGLPYRDAIIQFEDKTVRRFNGIQGGWDENDVICLCFNPEDWPKIERILFIESKEQGHGENKTKGKA